MYNRSLPGYEPSAVGWVRPSEIDEPERRVLKCNTMSMHINMAIKYYEQVANPSGSVEAMYIVMRSPESFKKMHTSSDELGSVRPRAIRPYLLQYYMQP
jgi:hypothetical protein